MVRLLANPMILRGLLLLFAAGSGFVFAAWLMRSLRRNIAAEADLGSGSATTLEKLPLHLYLSLIHI